MAHVIIKKLTNPARYIGQYLKPYLATAESRFAGALAEELRLNDRPRDRVLHYLTNGAIENVGETQNAWKTQPDAAGRAPLRAFEITISFDKHFSAAYAVCRNHREALIRTAVEAAEKGLSAFESRFVGARAGSDRHHVRGQWILLPVLEFLSRNQEPQVHLHGIGFTVIRCEDGAVRSVDMHPLLAHTKWLGALITAEHAKLLKGLGLEVDRRSDGKLTIRGIPDALCEAWSSRRREVLAYMAANGLSTPKQSDFAAIASRKQKEHHEPLERALARHEREARQLGFDPHRIEALCFGREKDLDQKPPERDLHETLARFAAKGEFTHLPDFERALAAEAPRLGIGIDAILAHARAAVRGLDGMLDGLERDRDRREFEKTLDTLYERPGESAKARAREHAAKKHALTPADEVALDRLTEKGHALRLLDAPDAKERHRVLAALRDALARSGVDTVGLTLRTKDAEALRDETKIPSFTAARALHEWRRVREPALGENRGDTAFHRIRTTALQDTLALAAGLRSKGATAWRSWQRERAPLDLRDGAHVLVIEEAQTLSARRLGAILDEAKRAGATVILSGDLQKSSRFALVAKEQVASLRIDPRERERKSLEGLLRMLRPPEPRLAALDPTNLGLSK